jgi:ABC-type sugar transport system permease subunit
MGLVNAGLRGIGLDNLAMPWLGDPRFALPALVLPIAWINIGFYVLVVYAGLLNIPQDIYDAALMDGAQGWTQFWLVTVPLLWDIVIIVGVFIVVGALNEFSLVLIMTNGGPSRSTELMATYMYKLFLGGRYGYGTAVGVIQFALSALVLWLARRLMRKEAVEY